jgi:hypothetical protein
VWIVQESASADQMVANSLFSDVIWEVPSDDGLTREPFVQIAIAECQDTSDLVVR